MAISIKELLEAGAHFGHQTHRWNPKMGPYIYGARNGIHIIDLQKTAKRWRKAEEVIVRLVASGQRVLFVGTKPQAQDIVAEEATRAGQFYVNRRWLGGMLTNFKTIRTRLDRLQELDRIRSGAQTEARTKRETLRLDKEWEKLERSLRGIKDMTKLPGLVLVVDPKCEHIAVSEAQKLGIPIVGITDTNCNPEGIDFVVPGNDDAAKSVRLFVKGAADACLEGNRSFERRIQEETRRRQESEQAEKAAAKTPAVAPVLEAATQNRVAPLAAGPIAE